MMISPTKVAGNGWNLRESHKERGDFTEISRGFHEETWRFDQPQLGFDQENSQKKVGNQSATSKHISKQEIVELGGLVVGITSEYLVEVRGRNSFLWLDSESSNKQ